MVDDIRAECRAELLIECFERRHLSAFPLALGAVNRNPEKHLFVQVYCVCQLLESYDSNMIQYDKCGQIDICIKVPKFP